MGQVLAAQDPATVSGMMDAVNAQSAKQAEHDAFMVRSFRRPIRRLACSSLGTLVMNRDVWVDRMTGSGSGVMIWTD